MGASYKGSQWSGCLFLCCAWLGRTIVKTNLAIWAIEDEEAFFAWTEAFLGRRTCPFLLESYVRGDETGIFQFHVLLWVFPWKWNDNEVLKAWMHHFYIHICFFFHHFLQKGLMPSTHHLHLFTEFVCLVLESVAKEAFLLISSIAGLLLCEKSSILEGLSSRVELNSSCIWRSFEWSWTCN